MALTPAEHEQVEHFAEQYRLAQSPIMLELERSFCGCDYGGTSWTTREQAERIACVLGLGPGSRLLEVGAGSGWPALYVAGISGCDVTLTDVPLPALRIAAARVVIEKLTATTRMAVADGAALPFVDGCFDAVSHSDVLCCLQAKLAVLRSCRRVIGATGRMAFTVISVRPGLCAADHARATELGPPFVHAEAGYAALLEAAAWDVEDCLDLTDGYACSIAHSIRQFEESAEQLRELMGASAYEERLARKEGSLVAVEDGLHRRELYVARPSRRSGRVPRARQPRGFEAEESASSAS